MGGWGLLGDTFISPSSTQLPKYNIGFWAQSVNMRTSKGLTVHYRGGWTPWLSVPLPPSLSITLSLTHTLPRTHTPTHTHSHTHFELELCVSDVELPSYVWFEAMWVYLSWNSQERWRVLMLQVLLIHSTLSKDKKSSLHQWHNQSVRHFKCQAIC